MNQKFDKKDIILLTVLFLIAFWLWTLPIQHNNLPFGEGDAAYHFGYGDYMTSKDKSMNLTGLPVHIGFWYYGWNSKLGPMALEYPPPYHLDYSIAQIFGKDRFVSPYILIAITSFLAVFSMYLLLRKSYGFLIAGAVSFWLIFEMRAIMTYLWGQRPTIASFTYIPIIIYVLYKYSYEFYENKKEKNIYLYILVVLSSCAFLIHLQGFILVIIFSVIFLILLYIKYKKVIITKTNYKPWIICLVIGIILCAPFLVLYTGTGESAELGKYKAGSASLLFKWLDVPDNKFSLNPTFSTYKDNYISYLTVVFLLIGLLFLFLKRRINDLVMISLFVTLYLIFHLHVFGLAQLSYRIARYLMVESYLFCFLIIFGIIIVADLLKKHVKISNLSMILVLIFLSIVIMVQGKVAYDSLNQGYGGVARMTQSQYEFAEWADSNLPKDAVINDFGTLTYGKLRFMQASAHRPFFWNDINITHTFIPISGVGKDLILKTTYIMLDYSDVIAIGDKQNFNALTQFEKQLSGAALVYNKNNIRVYKIG